MHGINRIFHLNFLTFYFQSTSLGAVSTVNSTCQFASSASKKSGKTTGDKRKEPMVIEARGLSHAGTIKPFDLDIHKGEVIGLTGLLGSKIVEIFSHHSCYQLHSRKICDLILANQLTISKNGNSVTYCINLFQEMSNKYDSYTFLLQSAQNREF